MTASKEALSKGEAFEKETLSAGEAFQKESFARRKFKVGRRLEPDSFHAWRGRFEPDSGAAFQPDRLGGSGSKC